MLNFIRSAVADVTVLFENVDSPPPRNTNIKISGKKKRPQQKRYPAPLLTEHGPPPVSALRQSGSNRPLPSLEQERNGAIPWPYLVEWFHGTKKETAFEMKQTRLIQFGESKPMGFYISPDFNFAKGYAGKNGAVIVVRVHPPLQIINKRSKDYYIPAPEGVRPHSEYFSLKNISLEAVLDIDGYLIG